MFYTKLCLANCFLLDDRSTIALNIINCDHRMSPLYANLLAAVLFVLTCHSTPVASYKILMLPISAKSHVFSMMAIAEGLASRGQEVTMVLSRNMKLDVPEVKNGKQKGIFVERYEDAMDDIEAIYDNITLKTLEGKMTMRSHFAHAVNMYVLFSVSCKMNMDQIGAETNVIFNIHVRHTKTIRITQFYLSITSDLYITLLS